MLDWPLVVNTVACSTMLAYTAAIAIVMPGPRDGMWGRRLVIWALALLLGSQAASPWTQWLANPAWQYACLNALFALIPIVWWREARAFVKCKFMLPPEFHPQRRSSDWGHA